MDRSIPFRKPPVKSKASKLSFISKLFFCLDIVQVLVVGGLQISMMLIGDYRPVVQGGMGLGRQLYMIVFTCCVIYTCLLCLFAVRLQNFLEIVAFLVQNYLFMCYSFIQVYHLVLKKDYSIPLPVAMKKHPVVSILVVCDSVYLVIMNIIFTVLAVKLFQEYGWKIYKKVRFNVKLRGSYHMYELVLCLMKMNFLILAMFCICYNQTVLRDLQSSPYYHVTVASIPTGAILGFIGYFGIRKENKIMTVMFTVAIIFAMGCYAFAIYKVLKLECYGCMAYFGQGIDLPRELILHLAYLATLGLLFSIALCVTTIKAFCNFGKGLKKHFAESSRHGSMITLSMGITRNLSEMFRSIETESENLRIARNEVITSRDFISMTTMTQQNMAHVVTRECRANSAGEKDKDDLCVEKTLSDKLGRVGNSHEGNSRGDDSLGGEDSLGGINLSYTRDNVFEQPSEEGTWCTNCETSNNEASTSRNTSADYIQLENATEGIGASRNSSVRPLVTPRLASRRRGSLMQLQQQQQQQQENNLLSNFYNETLKKLNNLYANTRRRINLANKLKRSKANRGGAGHIPAFSTAQIMSNNGIGVDTGRGRKIASILHTGLCLGDIETEVITNISSLEFPDNINVGNGNISNVEGSSKESSSPQSRRQRTNYYKYSVSELYTADNVIYETEDEEVPGYQVV